MENEEKFSVDTENLKTETKETVNQVKESIKNVNLKNDAEETKGFLKEMISNPFEAVKMVANEEENVFKKVIIIMLVFIIASAAYSIISVVKYGKYLDLLDNVMTIVAGILYPIFFVLAPAVIVLILNKNNKKSLITIISTIVVASVPVVINHLIDIVEILVSGISIVTGPISTGLSAVAIVLTYFGIKDLFGIEEHKDFVNKYVVIKIAAALIITILSRIGIC